MYATSSYANRHVGLLFAVRKRYFINLVVDGNDKNYYNGTCVWHPVEVGGAETLVSNPRTMNAASILESGDGRFIVKEGSVDKSKQSDKREPVPDLSRFPGATYVRFSRGKVEWSDTYKAKKIMDGWDDYAAKKDMEIEEREERKIEEEKKKRKEKRKKLEEEKRRRKASGKDKECTVM